MLDRVLAWKREAVLLVVAVFCISAFLLLPHLGYVRELTIGGGMLTDTNKLQDMMIVPLAVLLQLMVLVFYLVSPASVGQEQVQRAASGLVMLVVLFALAAIFWLDQARSLAPFAAVAITIWGSQLFWKQDASATAGWLFLVAAMACILVWHGVGIAPFRSLGILYPLLAVGALFVGIRWVLVLGIVALLLLAGVVFLSAPGFWMPASSGISPLDMVFAAIGLLVLVQAAMALPGIRAFPVHARAGNGSVCPMASVPVPPAFSMALALAVLCLSWRPILLLPTDDYHFGETLLAYQALVTGQGWFVDFFSPHGLSDGLAGLIAHLAGNDTASAIQFGMGILTFAVALLVQWRLLVRLGPAGGLLVGLVIPINDTILFTLLVLLLVIETATIRHALLAGACAAGGSAAGAFLYGGPGVAAALAGGTGALCLHAWRDGWPAALRFIGGGLAVCLLVAALAWPQLQGQFAFLKTSAAANLTIYGNNGKALPQFMIFALGPFLVVLLACWGRISKPETGWRRAAMVGTLVLPVTLLILLLNSYAMARLDTTGLRAMITSCVMLAFLPVWLTCVRGNGLPDARIHAVCGLLLVLTSNYPPPLAAAPGFLPTVPGQNTNPISAQLPRLGNGLHDAAHVRQIETIANTVDLMLEPGEPFLNLTDRNALHYYLDRPATVPVTSPYNAAPLDFQALNIRAMEQNPPPLALIWADNIEADGINLTLRAHNIARYVMAYYTPFTRNGYIYGIRNDLAARLSRLLEEEEVFHLLSVKDQNWRNGIAIGANAENWSVAVRRSAALVLKPGDILLFAGDVTRQVVAIEGLYVRLDSPLPESLAQKTGPVTFHIANRPAGQPEARELWAQAFHHPELWQIPSAWGRSEGRLSRFLEPVDVPLQVMEPGEQGSPRPAASGPFRLDVGNRQLVLRTMGGLDPQMSGILALNAACTIPKAKPVLTLSWRAGDVPFSSREQFIFHVSHARNLIPLDSSPLWTMSGKVQEIRIEILNPDLCGVLTVSDLGFMKRVGKASAKLSGNGP